MMCLVAGLLAVLVLTCLPWALKTIWYGGGVTYHWLRYPLGTVMGDPLSSVSALLAFAALIASLFNFFGKARQPTVCGGALLASAGVEIANGCIFGFQRFTVLTYSIIAGLLGLGVFALLGFRRSR